MIRQDEFCTCRLAVFREFNSPRRLFPPCLRLWCRCVAMNDMGPVGDWLGMRRGPGLQFVLPSGFAAHCFLGVSSTWDHSDAAAAVRTLRGWLGLSCACEVLRRRAVAKK
ncbi:uncharacterized protein Tco025E_04378 [Trypanosoma conorhini]|uniref:Uncharacterized protein n=1 Tax=Trypanosoma conorhini TaxID=83891 RepID=A0A3R7NHP5_9TRYP|nr:uncharacterized protein Tco025E_04378 [Trypanosoma conorhini]RNF18682.1 hypothetical protein Tco025E_04378 [Trypanosoma conorhini]